jgi:hypothetical protein
MTAPLDESSIGSFPTISGGGRHMTTVRTIIIDIPLTTPPLADLISYAKARKLPLDDLNAYAFGRYQAALSSVQTGFDARQSILNAYQTTNDAFKTLQGYFQIAKERHDVELQKSIAEKLVSVGHSLTSITDQLTPLRESIQKSDEKAKYWAKIVDLTKPAQP